MRWQLDWGHVAALYEEKRRKGRPVPTAYLRRPRLADRLVFAFDSFWELNTDRQTGMGMGPIPSQSIRSFAKDHELRGEAFDDFLTWIRVLDGEYIKRLTPKDEPKKR